MEQLKQTKKITLATLKSFAKRNQHRIHYKIESSFDGMTDMVETKPNAEWKPSKLIPGNSYYRSGIEGIYTVGSSRDYFKLYEDSVWIGIEVSNSCGSSILAVKKIEDLDDDESKTIPVRTTKLFSIIVTHDNKLELNEIDISSADNNYDDCLTFEQYVDSYKCGISNEYEQQFINNLILEKSQIQELFELIKIKLNHDNDNYETKIKGND